MNKLWNPSCAPHRSVLFLAALGVIFMLRGPTLLGQCPNGSDPDSSECGEITTPSYPSALGAASATVNIQSQSPQEPLRPDTSSPASAPGSFSNGTTEGPSGPGRSYRPRNSTTITSPLPLIVTAPPPLTEFQRFVGETAVKADLIDE